MRLDITPRTLKAVQTNKTVCCSWSPWSWKSYVLTDCIFYSARYICSVTYIKSSRSYLFNATTRMTFTSLTLQNNFNYNTLTLPIEYKNNNRNVVMQLTHKATWLKFNANVISVSLYCISIKITIWMPIKKENTKMRLNNVVYDCVVNLF